MLRAVRVNLALEAEAEAIHIQLSPTHVGVACCFPVLQLGWIDLAFSPSNSTIPFLGEFVEHS